MLRISVFILFIGFSVSIYGHGEIHERIDIVSKEIIGSPNDPMLYIKRASLYLDDGDFDETILDIERAKLLAGEDYPPAMMTYASMCYKMGTYEIALRHIDNFLSNEEGHVLGMLTKAKILRELDNNKAAAEYYRLAIEKTTTHLPENFLDLINVLIEDEEFETAFEVYEAAENKFGRLLVMDLKAMEIAKASNDYTKLFGILDEIIESQPRKERWYFQKAEIFIEIKEYEQAQNQLTLALESLKQLPYRIKITPAMQKLSAQISENIETIKSLPNEIDFTTRSTEKE